MRTAKALAAVLEWVSKVAAILYLSAGIYGMGVFLLSRSAGDAGLPITYTDKEQLIINFPFTQTPFLIGAAKGSSFAVHLIWVILYGGFFLLLAGIFDVFKRTRLFTAFAVMRLNRFYIINLVTPVCIILLLLMFRQSVSDFIIITILHMVLGIFAYFMASIFRQGLLLQEEQDLTL